MARAKSDKQAGGGSTSNSQGNNEASVSSPTEDSSTFARHAQNDEALQAAGDEDNHDGADRGSPGLSMSGRIMVFLVFPVTAGTVGLYCGYLESLRREEKQLSFDQDFVMPFLLALAMAVVLFFQTGGFATTKVKPLVKWPKVRRVKNIVRKKKGEAAADKVDYVSSKKDD